MSTCKDCIHSEKCRDYLAYKLDKAIDGINGSEKPICEFFKDKSKSIRKCKCYTPIPFKESEENGK